MTTNMSRSFLSAATAPSAHSVSASGVTAAAAGATGTTGAVSVTISNPATSLHSIPMVPWKAYFHEPEDKLWTADSYKLLQTITTWESLGALLRELGPHKTTNGLLRVMRGDTSPLWENKVNIRGGSYCLKVNRRSAIDVFQRYLAAAILGVAANNPANEIVGVTISPKRGFCIIKIWNLNCKAFNLATDLQILHEDVKTDEIIYRAHTDQRM
jgi:hypothetical protein